MASLAAMMRRVRSSSSGQTALNFCVNPTALELMDRNHGRFQRRLLPLFIYAALIPVISTSRPPGGTHAQTNLSHETRQSSPESFQRSRPFTTAPILSILHSAFCILHSVMEPDRKSVV